MIVAATVVWGISGVYAIILVYFIIGLFRTNKITTSLLPSASVVVCARNEEKTIRACVDSLLAQTVPVEIIVVDDRSNDATPDILREFGDSLHVIRIESCPQGVSPKKHALHHGIAKASGEVLLFTDADCIVPPHWAERHLSTYSDTVGVCAGVVYVSEKNFWDYVMNFELLALSVCTAGAIGMNNPMIATGNNLSYRKKAYADAGGIEPLFSMDSGDDDLMVQKIAQTDVWKTVFCADPLSFVKTEPVHSLSAFIRQRRRWASRGLDYPWWLIVILSMIYGMNLLFAAAPFLALLVPQLFSLLLLLIIMVCGLELLVLGVGFYILGCLKRIVMYPLVKVLHVPYILIMPVLGIFRGFTWK